MKGRILILFVVCFFVWSSLILRAGFLQFLPDQKLENLKQRQFQTSVILPARRGAILDRSGKEIALSKPAFSIFVDPKIVDRPRNLARALAKLTGQSREYYRQKLEDRSRRFVWLDRQLDESVAKKIRSLGFRGLGVTEDWKRVYPNEGLLTPVLGFLGSDSQGLEGLEIQYEDILRGNQQKLSTRRDARGRPLVSEGLVFAENQDGQDLHLTIDLDLQYKLEMELAKAQQEFAAVGAVGIVLDAKTSAIRAMASLPSGDGNRGRNLSPDLRRNRSVADAFEPGSTLKTFVVAAGLAEKVIQPNTKYFCEDGSFKVGDRIIREADQHHSFGWLTVSEILAFSSNIGTAKIALGLGPTSIRGHLANFGFGGKLGVDLPGEAKGSLQNLPWNNHLLSNVSFGQGISVTALQIANAYAAIANGGELNTPYIVESIRDPGSGEIKSTAKKTIRRVLTAEDSAHMRVLLSSVTAEGGTGVNAKVDGFIVAGKTGTAQKPNPVGRGYLPNQYISSFAGFIPAHDPRFVIFVAIDQPQKAYYGSQVAAPIFSRVAGFAARKEGLAPMLLSEKDLPAKNFKREQKSAMDKLEQMASPSIEQVPTMEKLSLREVIRNFENSDVQLKIHGKGRVSQTLPEAGAEIPADRTIQIFLSE